MGITETIAKEPVHSNQICKFISGLLFTTIKNSVGTTHERVAFSICSGWIDILMSQTTPRPENHAASRHVYVRLEADEAATFLQNSAQFLVNQVDQGNFEGVVGANKSLVMKLELVSDLLYILAYAKTKENESSVCSLFGSGQHIEAIESGLTNLLTWLFHNHREKEEKTNNSPALEAINRISELTTLILQQVGEFESVIKIALSKLIATVKNIHNQEVLSLSKSQ